MNIKFYNNEVRYLINTNWHQKFRLNFSINNRNMYCRNKLNPYFSLDKYKDIPNYNLLYIMAVDEDEIDDLDFGYGFNNFKNFNEKLLYLEISLQYIYSKIILKVHKSRKLSKIFKSNYCYTLIWEDENFLILSMDYSKKKV